MNQSQANLCVFCKLDEKNELMIFVSANFDNCAATGLESDANWFVTEL